MSWAGELVVGLVILVGLVGIIVPLIPGTILVIGAIGVWAWQEGSALSWSVFGVAAALIVATTVVKYAWPGKRLKGAGIPNRTLLFGVVVGIVGFFVVPIVGLPLGFVVGIYASEFQRQGNEAAARSSTVAALKAVGLSMMVELVGATLACVRLVRRGDRVLSVNERTVGEPMRLGRYLHYKGDLYEVTGMALHTETEQTLVLYRSVTHGAQDDRTFARPAAMFLESVVVDGVDTPRFTYLG